MRTLFLSLLGFIAISGVFWAPSAFALDDYVLLAPLPGLESTESLQSGEGPLTNYLTTIYQIGVSAVLVIAVVMFIVGGIQYMTSDSIAGKGNGRDTIAKALIGILLATGSYLLLFIIGGAGSVRVGFDMPKLGFVGAVDRNNQICEITFSASAGNHNGFFSRQDYDSLPQCACDKDLTQFDCPHAKFFSINGVSAPPETVDVSSLNLFMPGFSGKCIDVGNHPILGPTVFVINQTASRVGACAVDGGSIENPSDNLEP